MRLAQWARLLTAGRLGLRAGAWYSVVGRTPKEVQLAVRGRTVTVARTLVELRDTPPSDWTVVHPVGGREYPGGLEGHQFRVAGADPDADQAHAATSRRAACGYPAQCRCR